jgi:chemotaxis protein histidine kinase CheA
MTASPPKVNGHARPPAPPVLGDWQPIGATPTPQTETVAESTPQSDSDLVAQAQAEAIRAAAWAESEERRLAAEAEKIAALKRAEAEAKAIRVKAEEEARKLRLANDRAERKAREDEAASQARIAEANRRRDEANRAREQEARQAREQQQSETAKAEAVERSSKRWRNVAMSFYALCATVALPVQMAAFWDPNAKYLLVAPIFIEVIALVALVGAAAAVTDGRPQWHYRLVAWVGALTAATINVVHGLDAFDPATAFGTALASLAGPGMWDLHEHGRIRKRDGKLTWREQRAAEKAAKEEAKQKAAEEKRRAAEKAAADKAAAEAAQQLAERRARLFPKVWEHAERLAADLGETTVTEAVWERAKLDVEGAKPGESAEVLRMRNAAEARVEAARQKRPVNTLSKTTNAQRAIQTPRSSYRPVPPRRKPGDTPRYDRVAGRAHGELLRSKQAAKNARQNAN